jgi:hypothetical protein
VCRCPWQSTFDGGFDEARREEGQRDRHIDVALKRAYRRGLRRYGCTTLSLPESHLARTSAALPLAISVSYSFSAEARSSSPDPCRLNASRCEDRFWAQCRHARQNELVRVTQPPCRGCDRALDGHAGRSGRSRPPRSGSPQGPACRFAPTATEGGHHAIHHRSLCSLLLTSAVILAVAQAAAADVTPERLAKARRAGASS